MTWAIVRTKAARRTEEVLRRSLDICVAAVGLILGLPLLGAAAALVKLQDGGPVIHRRRVLGLGGQEFGAYKLRTMVVDADDWLARSPDLRDTYERSFKLEHDPRVTAVGRVLRRFAIDEIPQLINVLRGEMSLVGPRMMHPSELARYGPLGPELLTVKPGLTGLWQVDGSRSDFASRIELNRAYLRGRSLRLDLEILVRTIPSLVRGGRTF